MDQLTVVLPHPRSRSAAPAERGLALRHTVSMTAGAEGPVRALTDAPTAATLVCHPYDEAIVRHLVAHVGRADCEVRVDPAAVHGQLAVSLRLAYAS